MNTHAEVVSGRQFSNRQSTTPEGVIVMWEECLGLPSAEAQQPIKR